MRLDFRIARWFRFELAVAFFGRLPGREIERQYFVFLFELFGRHVFVDWSFQFHQPTRWYVGFGNTRTGRYRSWPRPARVTAPSGMNPVRRSPATTEASDRH